jgi:hypothetical protein
LRNLLIGIVACALAFSASGCGSDESSAEAETTAAEPSEEESLVPAGALDEIREDFALNFTGVSWHTPPETLEIEGSTLVARTDFFPDDEGRELGTNLCNALNANYVLSNTAAYGLAGVTVYAQADPVAHASNGGTC